MTLTSALAIMREKVNVKPEIMTLVEEALDQTKTRAKRLSSSLRAGQPTGYSGVDKAKNMLNEMIEEVQEKYDLELQKCCDYDEMQSTLIEEARQDISMFNAEAAEARSEVLQAESVISMCEIKLPELNDALDIHNRECHEQITELNRLLKIVLEDIKVMEMILGMTSCKSTKSMFLLQRCEDSCGNSFVSFAHSDVSEAASKLKSDSARQLMNDGLEEAYSAANDTELTTWAPEEVPSMQRKRSRPCKTPAPTDKRAGKCSMDTNPNCPIMQEKFEYIKAGIEDRRDELQDQLAELEKHCEETTSNLEAQIS